MSCSFQETMRPIGWATPFARSVGQLIARVNGSLDSNHVNFINVYVNPVKQHYTHSLSMTTILNVKFIKVYVNPVKQHYTHSLSMTNILNVKFIKVYVNPVKQHYTHSLSMTTILNVKFIKVYVNPVKQHYTHSLSMTTMSSKHPFSIVWIWLSNSCLQARCPYSGLIEPDNPGKS